MMATRAVLLLVAASAAACKDSTSTPPSPVASITVSLDSLATVPGAVLHLRAAVRDSADSPLPNERVVWIASDTQIATVDSTGVSVAVAPGTARIVASSGAHSDTLYLRVDLVTFTAITAGDYHACGLTPAGGAYCWGWGASGELGIGDTIHVAAPVKVRGGHAFSQVVAGYRHTCGLTTGGAVYCWGSNDIGQVGIGTRDTLLHLVPEPVNGGAGFATISAGDFHTCARTSGGAVSCWGYGHFGQLGNGDTVSVNPAPRAMAGGVTFAALSGGQVHSCGIAVDSAAYCWGLPDGGRLGAPSCGASPCYATPQVVSGSLKFVALSVGEVHSCGIAAGGAAWCWGSNLAGQLGVTRDTLSMGTPIEVSGGQSFARVAAASYHTCALTAGGAASCWGDNAGGQLGDGTLQSSTAPVPVAGGLTFAALSGATGYTCGVTTANVAYCWGTDLYGYGQLGVGGGTGSVLRMAPARVLGQP